MTYPNRPGQPERAARTRKPQPIGTFTDCHQLWETALLNGALEVEYDRVSPAIAMAQRMNTYRTLLRERNAGLFEGAEYASPYDHLQVARRGSLLIIAMRPSLAGATIRKQDGTPIDLVPFSPIEGAAPAEQLSPRHVGTSDDDMPE